MSDYILEDTPPLSISCHLPRLRGHGNLKMKYKVSEVIKDEIIKEEVIPHLGFKYTSLPENIKLLIK